MSSSTEANGCRIPSLVTYCQRVAIMNLELIAGLGDAFRSDLIRPILEQCDAETLRRLEDETPAIKSDTEDIWETLCLKTFPLTTGRIEQGEISCWRNQYFTLCQEESDRLNRLGSKMRKQREAAEDKRKEGVVKFTDRPPPMKRARTWGMSAQPKTLFQKTKSEASKIQRTMYTPRAIPSMPSGKSYRVLPPTTKAPLLPAPSQPSSRVSVTTVRQTRPSHAVISSPDSQIKDGASPPSPSKSSTRPPPDVSSRPPPSPPKPTPVASVVSQDLPTNSPLRRNYPARKDPISAIFMPKHRAYSQRPR